MSVLSECGQFRLIRLQKFPYYERLREMKHNNAWRSVGGAGMIPGATRKGSNKNSTIFFNWQKKTKSRPQCNSHKKHSITENFLLHWSQLMNIPNDNCTYNECVQLVWLKKRIGRGGKFFGGPRVAKNHATPLPICMKPPRQK